MSQGLENRRILQFGGLWQHPNFLKLWAGQTISMMGSQVTIVALPLVAVLALNATPLEMGLLGALNFAPSLLFGLFVGGWIDRRRKRPLLLSVELARAMLLGSIPVTAMLGWLWIGQLYVVSFLIGVLALIFEIAYQSFLPALVSRPLLVEGNSKLEMSYAITQLTGPGLAGWLVQLLTAPIAMLGDACSFLLSALSFWLIPDQELVPTHQPRQHFRKEIGEGLHSVWAQPVLRSLMACQMIDSLFSTMLFAVYTMFLTRDLNLSSTTYGILLAMFAPGSFIGAVLAGALGRRLGVGNTMIIGQILIVMGFMLRAVSGGPLPHVVAPLIAAHLAIGCGNRLYGINQVSLRQSIIPAALQGRAYAAIRFLLATTTPIGALLGGVLGQQFGLRPTLVVAAVGVALALGWLVCSPVRRVRVIAP